jgi:dienelactone hydrolase
MDTALGESAVRIPASGGADLAADLALPHPAAGLVMLASCWRSPPVRRRTHTVAAALAECDFATLRLDLLTAEESARDEHSGEYRYDIGLLARRLVDAIDWAKSAPQLASLPLALYSASTAAAAALVAAAERPARVHAVLSCGGRPDLAGETLERVEAPALLIVGSRDDPVAAMNRDALKRLRAHAELAIVPGASHAEDHGTLDEVARLVVAWCQRYLWSMA